MRISENGWHEGWEVTTSCQEDNVENWKPGDPIRYRAWGEATLRQPQLSAEKWTTTTPIRVQPAHFYDFNVAHRDIKATLISEIDARKKAI